MKLKDKRRFLRVSCLRDVAFKCSKGQFWGLLKDVSLGGGYISEATGLPQVHEKIEMSFYLDFRGSENVIHIKGEVVRIESERAFAVKFAEIDQKSFFHLKNLITYNVTNPEEAEKELSDFLGEAYPLFQSLKYLHIRDLKRQLMLHLLKRAFLFNSEKPFILSSGKESPYYLDCRKITLYGPAFQLIGDLFWEEIRFSFVDGIAGMSIGADPIVCAILSSAIKENVPLEGLLIRKEPKKYGTQKQLEGQVRSEMRVILVEDVVTTGGSVLKALSVLRNEGLKVLKIIALVDRNEGGKEAIEKEGVPYTAFFTMDEIISAQHALA